MSKERIEEMMKIFKPNILRMSYYDYTERRYMIDISKGII